MIETKKELQDFYIEKPKMEDFYDTSDPRGCSSSEYEDYQKALEEYNNKMKQNQ